MLPYADSEDTEQTSLDAQVILLVLSCAGLLLSFLELHVYSNAPYCTFGCLNLEKNILRITESWIEY